MEISKKIWKFNEVFGNSWKVYGNLKKFMEIEGNSLKFKENYENWWKFIEIYTRSLWKFMEICETFMEIDGNSKKFVEVYGNSWKFKEVNGNWWTFTEIYRKSLWTKFIGFFWKLLENRDFLDFFATYLYGHSLIFLQNNQNSFVKNQNLWKLGKFMESIRRMEISWKFTEVVYGKW